MTTLHAEYDELGEIVVFETFDDGSVSESHISWYDADGGTWQDEGYEPVGEWTVDAERTATITVVRA